jgi:hypothetical protein
MSGGSESPARAAKFWIRSKGADLGTYEGRLEIGRGYTNGTENG